MTLNKWPHLSEPRLSGTDKEDPILPHTEDKANRQSEQEVINHAMTLTLAFGGGLPQRPTSCQSLTQLREPGCLGGPQFQT